MKTIEIKLYSFDELSEDAQRTALEALYDLNFEHEWYNDMYEDAERVGLKITSFDIDRGSYCNTDFKWSALETARVIMQEHGEGCDTYKVAETFLSDYDKLVTKHSDGVQLDVVAEDNEYEFDSEADELESEFKNDLENEYLKMLRQEYEYLGSKEAIIENIKANEYDFTEDGKLY
jgi:hypothetical protein